MERAILVEVRGELEDFVSFLAFFTLIIFTFVGTAVDDGHVRPLE